MAELLTRLNSAWSRGWKTARSVWRYGTQPPTGQKVVSDARLDYLRAAVSDTLNFSSLRSMLVAADGGDLARGLKLFEEMLQKDATLYSVAQTRMDALTGLEYEIVSAADVDETAERESADEAADYVRRRLSKLEGFDSALEHMATAIGSNLTVNELVWEGRAPIEIINVPIHRLRQEANEPGLVRVVVDEDRKGVPAEGPKWVVHVPASTSGYPFTRSILRAQAFVYLTKMLALTDWIVFCEIFGMPIRIAKYATNTTPEEKEELIGMMKNLGSKAFGVFSQSVTLDFVESSQRGTAPFQTLIDWCDRTQAKIWLGGNLLSDTTAGTGTRAAASAQDELREDLRDGDIKREGRTIRQQILGPMCAYRFGCDVPVPYFGRVKPEAIDRIQEGSVMECAQRIGMAVPEKWARDRLGIPKPEKADAVRTRPDAFEEGVTEGPGGAY